MKLRGGLVHSMEEVKMKAMSGLINMVMRRLFHSLQKHSDRKKCKSVSDYPKRRMTGLINNVKRPIVRLK